MVRLWLVCANHSIIAKLLVNLLADVTELDRGVYPQLDAGVMGPFTERYILSDSALLVSDDLKVWTLEPFKAVQLNQHEASGQYDALEHRRGEGFRRSHPILGFDPYRVVPSTGIVVTAYDVLVMCEEPSGAVGGKDDVRVYEQQVAGSVLQGYVHKLVAIIIDIEALVQKELES